LAYRGDAKEGDGDWSAIVGKAWRRKSRLPQPRPRGKEWGSTTKETRTLPQKNCVNFRLVKGGVKKMSQGKKDAIQLCLAVLAGGQLS